MEIFDWDNAAAGNGFAAPDGFPEGMNYSQVNNAAREIMAVISRYHTDTSGELTTAGTASAYTLAGVRSLSGYTDGLVYRFQAHTTSSGAATLNVASQGAASLVMGDNTALQGGELVTGGIYEVVYSSTYTAFVLRSPGIEATTAIRGEVELATDAEAETGTAADRVITPENLGAVGIWKDSRLFESAEQTITDNSLTTVAHGLGVAPKLHQLFMVCKTAEGNYAVGEEVVVPSTPADSDGAVDTNRNPMVSADTTNCYIVTNGVYLANKSTRAAFKITNANWRFVVRAFA